jgi:ketosteroid isomerase-like protein
MKTLLVLSLGCLVLASCSAPAPDIAKARQEVVAFNDKVEKEMVAGIVDTTMSQYTDDAVSMPNNGPMLKGKAAIKEYFSKMMSMGVKFTAVDFTNTDLAAGGPYVYDIGTYAMTFQIRGMPEFTDHGKYMTIFERVADGSLKIKAETWNTNTEMPMHAPGEPAK